MTGVPLLPTTFMLSTPTLSKILQEEDASASATVSGAAAVDDVPVNVPVDVGVDVDIAVTT